jgi:hypothetical protein
MDENINNKLVNTLDVIVKLSAITISIGFIISITYDFGYFMAFGLSFSDIPSTINDHIRNSLICIPYSASTIAIWLFLKFLNDVSEQTQSKQDSPNSMKLLSTGWKFFMQLHADILKMLGLFGIVAYILFGNQIPLSYIVFGAFFLFYEIIFSKLLKLYDFSKLNRGTIVFILFSPLLLGLVLLRGNYNSKKDQSSTSAIYKLYLKDVSLPIIASNIRYFDKSIFVISPNSKYPSFIQLSELKKIEQVARNKDGYKGIIDYFGYELTNPSL